MATNLSRWSHAHGRRQSRPIWVNQSGRTCSRLSLDVDPQKTHWRANSIPPLTPAEEHRLMHPTYVLTVGRHPDPPAGATKNAPIYHRASPDPLVAASSATNPPSRQGCSLGCSSPPSGPVRGHTRMQPDLWQERLRTLRNLVRSSF